jgi:hypothetical protein
MAFYLFASSHAHSQKANTGNVGHPSSQFEIVGFRIERDTLKMVQEKLGTAPNLRNLRDASDGDAFCYMSPTEDETRVLFLSGPMGGWERLDSFAVISPQGVRGRKYDCVLSAEISEKISTPGGLRLGLTRAEVDRILGKPPKIMGHELIYEWLTKQKMTDEELAQTNKTFHSAEREAYYDVETFISVRFLDGKLVFFQVQHDISY